MKTNFFLIRCRISTLALSILMIGIGLNGQDSPAKTKPSDRPGSASAPLKTSPGGVRQALAATQLDNPGEFDKEFGMPPTSRLAKTLRPLSKIDMDGDLDYNGMIENDSSSNQGVNETEAPGLQIGVGELSKLVIRFKTYEKDYPGELYVKMDVRGINRFAESGEFGSEEQEKGATGRIRVWRDIGQTELLLDSDDPEKRTFEWKVDKATAMRGLPGNVPRTVYVEGVEASIQFEGDIRLMVSSSHTLSSSEPRQASPHYKTAFDHMVLTVREKPIKKEFINNNAEAVWSKRKKAQ